MLHTASKPKETVFFLTYFFYAVKYQQVRMAALGRSLSPGKSFRCKRNLFIIPDAVDQQCFLWLERYQNLPSATQKTCRAGCVPATAANNFAEPIRISPVSIGGIGGPTLLKKHGLYNKIVLPLL